MEKHERLRAARIAAGYKSAAEAAARHGWKVEAYRHHENGTAGYRADRAAEYAAAYDVDETWLLFERGRGPVGTTERGAQSVADLRLFRGSDLQTGAGRSGKPPAFGARAVGRAIPILGEVAAGSWKETAQAVCLPEVWDEEVLSSQGIQFLALDVLGYERATLFALKVSGPSMNREYPDGTFVIAAPPPEAGIQAGDHVIVRRANSVGLIETTVKELVVDEAGKALLWPRSDHDDFQKPIPLHGPDGDQDRPEIIGVVVSSYRPRLRSGQPAIFAVTPNGHAE